MQAAAIICHARFLDLAAFDETLQACRYQIRYYDAGYDALTFDPVDTDLVVVLGGPIGADELEDGSSWNRVGDFRHLWVRRHGQIAGSMQVRILRRRYSSSRSP